MSRRVGLGIPPIVLAPVVKELEDDYDCRSESDSTPDCTSTTGCRSPPDGSDNFREETQWRLTWGLKVAGQINVYWRSGGRG
jgi:hypothetical protein